MMRPLDGMLVVTLEHAIAGPLCTRNLADLGARVIKIERPGTGDFARSYDQRVRGLASHFVWCNRSKESLTLDVKHPEAAPILARLMERADVLVQNLAPGAAARLGLSHAELSKRHPRLVVCDISGYGDSGPYRDKKAYDLLIQSEAGLLSVTGTEQEVVKTGISIADIAAGMHAYSGILAALLERARTGLGRRLDISLLEAMTEWMSYPLYYAFEGQPPPPRSGAAHATIYPYGPFRAGDGASVMLGIQNEREWANFCSAVLAQPELAVDPCFDSNIKRNSTREQLAAIVEPALSALSTAQLIERLERAGIANARVNSMRELWEHPQLAARGRWRTVETPAGPVPALVPPATLEGVEPRMDPVPAIGEHTGAILGELGFGAAEVARRRAERVV